MTPPGLPALLCTDGFARQHGERIIELAPDLGLVQLAAEGAVGEEALGAIELAFFSPDAWPERASRFMGAAQRADNLRWLHTFSAGVDDPLFKSFTDRGVTVTTSSGAAAPVARTVVMYLLALSRELPRLLRAQAAREWTPQPYDDIAGRTIGVIGMGPIGREIIRMTSTLGMRPIGMRRAVDGDEPCPTWPIDRLRELAAAVDVLVLALPLNEHTRGIVSADVIEQMPHRALFVNVGRGELVDEVALTAALASGRLGGAGLDVFTTEPLPSDSALWNMDNVIITPHSSAATDATATGAINIFFANLAAYCADEPMVNVAAFEDVL